MRDGWPTCVKPDARSLAVDSGLYDVEPDGLEIDAGAREDIRVVNNARCGYPIAEHGRGDILVRPGR